MLSFCFVRRLIIILQLSARAIWIEAIFNDKSCSHLHCVTGNVANVNTPHTWAGHETASSKSKIITVMSQLNVKSDTMSASGQVNKVWCTLGGISFEIEPSAWCSGTVPLYHGQCPWPEKSVYHSPLEAFFIDYICFPQVISCVFQNKAGKVSIYNLKHWSQREARLL